jgi:hypothetical protein
VDASVQVGDLNIAGYAYSWGSGMLNQLGLGARGSSKGRLLPTLIPFFQQNFPMQVTCVAAGANFSAISVQNGEVYSFGHAEYSQHGTGHIATRDYVDPYYYFEPRIVHLPVREIIVDGSTTTRQPIIVKSIVCGAMFTIAITENGELYSWGWNEGYALGRNIRIFAQAPQRIDKIGKLVGGNDENRLAMVSCGTKHCFVLKEEIGAPRLHAYRRLLSQPEYTDLMITIDEPTFLIGSSSTSSNHNIHQQALAGRNQKFANQYAALLALANNNNNNNNNNSTLSTMASSSASASASALGNIPPPPHPLPTMSNTIIETEFPCHRAIVATRSKYLHGLIATASYYQQKEQSSPPPLSSTATNTTSKVSIHLSGAHYNAVTIHCLLEYLYLNRVHIPSHKKREMILVAKELHLPDLEQMIIDSTSFDNTNEILTSTQQQEKHQQQQRYLTSLSNLIHNENLYADIVFIQHHAERSSIAISQEQETSIFHPEHNQQSLFGHRAIIQRIGYFEALLSSHFQDNMQYAQVEYIDTMGHSFTIPVQVIDVTHILEDDEIEFSMFHKLLEYAYLCAMPTNSTVETSSSSSSSSSSTTSSTCQMDMDEIMKLIVLSNRLGFTPLAQHCERQLALRIAYSSVEEVTQYHRFAQYFNLPRLEMQCFNFLRQMNVDLSSLENTDGEEAEV